MIIWIWSPKLLWKMAAVSREKPARRKAVMRVFQPTMMASAPRTSVAMTRGSSVPGTPSEDMYAEVPAYAPTLPRPESKNSTDSKMRPPSSETFCAVLAVDSPGWPAEMEAVGLRTVVDEKVLIGDSVVVSDDWRDGTVLNLPQTP